MEYYTEEKQEKVEYYDRYKNCKLLIDKETGDKYLESFEAETIPYRVDDIYHTVEANEAHRLDLIAYKYYGNPLLWWVLALANEIRNPIVAPAAGDVVRVPNQVGLYDKAGILRKRR